MVYVAHHGDDRRSGHSFGPGRLQLGDLGQIRLVPFLADRGETRRLTDQLDLVEVEPLIDGHHQPEVLEREVMIC